MTGHCAGVIASVLDDREGHSVYSERTRHVERLVVSEAEPVELCKAGQAEK